MIQKRHPGLQADRHAGPIYFNENIIRQVGAHIQKGHLLQITAETLVVGIGEEFRSRYRSGRHPLRILPVRHQPAIQMRTIPKAQELAHIGSWEVDFATHTPLCSAEKTLLFVLI